jgi:hypothetical protein
MPHPLDELLCDIRDLTEEFRAYNEAQPSGQAGSNAPAPVAEPGNVNARSFSAQPEGRLVGRNPRRGGLLLHNASDGTLLLAFGEDPATLDNYFYPIGPGETLDTRGVAPLKNLRGAISYGWVRSSTDLSDYPNGVFAKATGGAVKATELVLPSS